MTGVYSHVSGAHTRGQNRWGSSPHCLKDWWSKRGTMFKVKNKKNLCSKWVIIQCCSRMLLKSGADANLAMADGRTPMHIAAESGNIGVIKLLLENEADILATDQVYICQDFPPDLWFLLRTGRQLCTKPARCATIVFSSVWLTMQKSTDHQILRIISMQ